MHKKVGTITLEYDLSDGVGPRSAAFQGEFNNAIFRGDVSAMEGIFEGELSADSIDIVGNLNIAGRAAAITTVSTGSQVGGHDDDSVWRNVHAISFVVPPEDLSGGVFSTSVQYELINTGDSDAFPATARILLDGVPIWTGWTVWFSKYYASIRSFYHEVCGEVGPGTHTVTFQFKFDSAPTNPYPYFANIVFRNDYVRK